MIPHCAAVTEWNWLSAQIVAVVVGPMMGGFVSCTVSLMVQVALLPVTSVAVHEKDVVVGPGGTKGNEKGERWSQEMTAGAQSQTSNAVAENGSVVCELHEHSKGEPLAPKQCRSGAVVSWT